MIEITDWTQLKKKDLAIFPRRPWDAKSEYDCLLFYKGKQDSDFWHSGESWAYFDVIGINGKSAEVAARMDDMNIGDMYTFLINKKNTVLPFRMDCNKDGIFRFWGNNIKFVVGCSTNSTTIQIKEVARC